MSGKHDRSQDDEQSAKLLLTGPIVIRGLGRSVKDALRPGRPSRHRAFAGAEEPVEPTPVQAMLASGPSVEESGPSSDLADAPTTQAAADGSSVVPAEHQVPQTEVPDGPREDRVDERPDDAAAVDADPEVPTDAVPASPEVDGSEVTSEGDAAAQAPASDEPEAVAAADDAPVDGSEDDGRPVEEAAAASDDSAPDGSVAAESDGAAAPLEEPDEDDVSLGDDADATGVDDLDPEHLHDAVVVDQAFDFVSDAPEEQDDVADLDGESGPRSTEDDAPSVEADADVVAPADGADSHEVADDEGYSELDAALESSDSSDLPDPSTSVAEPEQPGDGASDPDDARPEVDDEADLEGLQPSDEGAVESEDVQSVAASEVVLDGAAPHDDDEERPEVLESSDAAAADSGADDTDSVGSSDDAVPEVLVEEVPAAEAEDESVDPAAIPASLVIDSTEDAEGDGSPTDDAATAEQLDEAAESTGAPADAPLDSEQADAAETTAPSNARTDEGAALDAAAAELLSPDAAPDDPASDDAGAVADQTSAPDPVLAEFIGDRGWTTAEELYSRPITLPAREEHPPVEASAAAEPNESDQTDAAGLTDEHHASAELDESNGTEQPEDDELAPDVEPTAETDGSDETGGAGQVDPESDAADQTDSAHAVAAVADEQPEPLAGNEPLVEFAPTADAVGAVEPTGEDEGPTDAEDDQESDPFDDAFLVADDFDLPGGPIEPAVARSEDVSLDAEPSEDAPLDAEQSDDDSHATEALGEQGEWESADELVADAVSEPGVDARPAEGAAEAGAEGSATENSEDAADTELDRQDEATAASDTELEHQDEATTLPGAELERRNDATDAPHRDEPTEADAVVANEGDDEATQGEADPASAPVPVAAATVATAAAAARPARPSSSGSGGSGRPPRRPRPLRERFGREAIGIAVLVVLALVCGGLITAVVLKTQRDAAIAASEAANYTPPPLATPQATPTATGPTVAVIGDGTTSAAASGVTSSQRWSALLQTSLKGTVTTDASSGMGYAAKGGSGQTFVQAAAKVPSDADVVIVFGGAADSNVQPLSLAKAATDTYAAVQKQAPDAKLIVVGPAISAGVSDADLTPIRNTLRSAAAIAKATFIDPMDAEWLSSSKQSADSPSALTASDEKTIASKMAAVVKKAVG